MIQLQITRKKCPGCGKDRPSAATACRFCETRVDAELAALFESEDRFAPITRPEPSDRQLQNAGPADTGTTRMTWLALILLVLLVIAALGCATLGALLLPPAEIGVGLICGACFLGILARLIQAREYHRMLTGPRSKHL